MTDTSKSRLKWILGLILAILTAVASYLSTGCSASRSVKLDVDSTFVKSLHIDTDFNSSVKR